MCGQVGLILGRKRRTKADLQDLRLVFELLLLHSEVRGPHATGVAWLQKLNGDYRLFKEPLPAPPAGRARSLPRPSGGGG